MNQPDQPRISTLLPGDVYRLPGSTTWLRVEKINGDKMQVSYMEFHGFIPKWHLQKELVSRKGNVIVEVKG